MIELKLLDRRHGDDGKGLVDLEEIDIVLAPAHALKQLLHCTDGSGRKPGWRLRVHRVAANGGERLQSPPVGLREAHQNKRCRAIGNRTDRKSTRLNSSH